MPPCPSPPSIPVNANSTVAQLLCDAGSGNAQFIRFYCLDAACAITSVLDFLPDGVTPYTPVGPVGVCTDVSGRDVEEHILCDVDGTTGQIIARFIRRITFDQTTGAVISVQDLQLDGTTPYVVTGTVSQCDDAPDIAPKIMCDVDPVTQAVIARFLRTYTYGPTGAVIAVTDTQLDGTTPYTPTGYATVCVESPAGAVQSQMLCDANGPFMRHYRFSADTGLLLTAQDTGLDGSAYVTSGVVTRCAEHHDWEILCGRNSTTGQFESFVRRWMTDSTGVTSFLNFRLSDNTVTAYDQDTVGTCPDLHVDQICFRTQTGDLLATYGYRVTVGTAASVNSGVPMQVTYVAPDGTIFDPYANNLYPAFDCDGDCTDERRCRRIGDTVDLNPKATRTIQVSNPTPDQFTLFITDGYGDLVRLLSSCLSPCPSSTTGSIAVLDMHGTGWSANWNIPCCVITGVAPISDTQIRVDIDFSNYVNDCEGCAESIAGSLRADLIAYGGSGYPGYGVTAPFDVTLFRCDSFDATPVASKGNSQPVHICGVYPVTCGDGGVCSVQTTILGELNQDLFLSPVIATSSQISIGLNGDAADISRIYNCLAGGQSVRIDKLFIPTTQVVGMELVSATNLRINYEPNLPVASGPCADNRFLRDWMRESNRYVTAAQSADTFISQGSFLLCVATKEIDEPPSQSLPVSLCNVDDLADAIRGETFSRTLRIFPRLQEFNGPASGIPIAPGIGNILRSVTITAMTNGVTVSAGATPVTLDSGQSVSWSVDHGENRELLFPQIFIDLTAGARAIVASTESDI